MSGHDYYAAAQDALDRSYRDAIGTGEAIWRATCAQAAATLALVDAINALRPEIDLKKKDAA